MSKIKTYYHLGLGYFRWFGYWAVELAVLLAVAIAITVAQWPDVTEKCLRYVGTLYLLAGTVYGAWALYQLRELFGLPSACERWHAWWAARPRDIVVQLKGQAASFSVGHATLTGWANMQEGPDQINALIVNVAQLRKDLDEANVEHRGAVQRLRTEFDAAKSASEQGVAHVSKLLRSAHTDGLGWAFAAIVCLIIGTVLTAIAPDVGKPADPPYVPYSLR